MLPGQSNRHHGVSQSFTGSDDDSNISIVDVSIHSRFHQSCGHKPPDFFLRRLFTSCLSWTDGSEQAVPVSVTKNMFDILTSKDWRSVYIVDAVKFETPESDQRLFNQAAVHIQEHLQLELDDIEAKIRCLTGSSIMTPDASFFRKTRKFFKAQSPLDVAHNYLIAKDNHKKPLWTKPFKRDAHEDIFDVLDGAQPERMTQQSSRKLLDVLQDQRKHLQRCLREWGPRKENYPEPEQETGLLYAS